MHNYILDFLSASEQAAIEASAYVARGDRSLAYSVASKALKDIIDNMPVSARVVSGADKGDLTPIIQRFDVLGKGGEQIDLVLDPIDGAALAASGQSNSIVSLAYSQPDSLLSVPNMYMEKVVTKVPYAFDLALPLSHNIRNLASTLRKSTHALKVAVLNKPRHQHMIEELRALNVKVYLINDGDILASLDVMRGKYDLLYSIGGAREGVISAAIAKALDGDMIGRLIERSSIKPTDEQRRREELDECETLGLKIGEIIPLSRFVKSANVFTVLTAITESQGMLPPHVDAQSKCSDSIIIDGYAKSIYQVNKSQHWLLT